MKHTIAEEVPTVGTALRVLTVLLLLSSLSAAPLTAQRSPRHAIGAEYAGLIFYGSTAVNYEFIMTERMSFRFGVGSAYASILVADIEAAGTTAMINFMSRGEHKFEGAFGLSVMRSNFSSVFDDERSDLGYHVYPALCVAYRSLPRKRGLFWRVGAAWMYGYGLPLLLGVGYVF